MTHFVPCMGLALSLALCGCRDASGPGSAESTRAKASSGAGAGAHGRAVTGTSPKAGTGAANLSGAQSAAALAVAVAGDPASARLPLRERLAHEASRRPEQAVRPEQLREALQGRGVALARGRQVLAAPVGAAYCEAAVSDQGLGLSLCEFADEAAAEAGRERSHELFDTLVPGRTLVAHGGSLLTLTQPGDERAAREAELVAGLFGALMPAPR